MTVARNVAEAISDHVTLEVECVDRLYLNLYQPLLQTPGGAAHFFRNVRGNPVPSPALMVPMTRAFVAAIEAVARDGNIDLVRFEKGERKDERTQAYLQQWPGGEGVLYIGKVQEKARVLRTQAQRLECGLTCEQGMKLATALQNAALGQMESPSSTVQ